MTIINEADNILPTGQLKGLKMGRTSTAKEKLINSAISLISNKSYSAVGVQELCNEAGVKKGSFYHFFESKKELTLVCLTEMWDFYKNEVLFPVNKLDISYKEKINILLQKSGEMQETSKESQGCVGGCIFGNLALEMSTQEEDIRLKISDVFSEWIDYFDDMLDIAKNKNEIPKNVDTRRTAKSWVAYIEGLSLMVKTFNDTSYVKSIGCALNSLMIYEEC